MTFADIPVGRFLESVADGSPTPSGGAVAAFVGAAGAALCELACAVTIDTPAYAGVHPELADRRADLVEKRGHLLDLADRDAAAVDAWLADSHPLDEIGNGAPGGPDGPPMIAVPLATADACFGVLEHAEQITAIGSRSVAGDAGTGARLAHTALDASVQNVRLNLGSIDEADVIDGVPDRVDVLERRAAACRDRAIANVWPDE